MKFSIIIPARNEETYLPACLEAIQRAAQPFPDDVEIIVVLNRCTDRTEAIARSAGAQVVTDDSKNLAHIRNTGIRAAAGQILITIDADSRMSPGMLQAIDRALASGRYIGGGAPIRTERYSLGIIMTALIIAIWCLPKGISAGLFWAYRSTVLELGGFNETLWTAEDIDFALRLKALGKKKKLRFGTVWHEYILSSCRKFDRFGDWYLIRNPRLMWDMFRGINQEAGNRFWYDVER